MIKPYLFFVPALLLSAIWAASAQAELQFHEGRWRLELTGASGIHQGNRDRSGDEKATLTAEYEFPATKRLTLGLQVTPLFMYDDPGTTVWGAGAGLAARVYQVKNEYRGLFSEAQGGVLVHHNRFGGNSSNFNFHLRLGIGYEFRNHWHVALQYAHISNSSLGRRNAGTNTVGVGIGFSF